MSNNNDAKTPNVDGEPKFGTKDEEIAFLRNKLDEIQLEFQEFQDSSRELELECETQIKQLEKRNDDLQYRLSRLEDENEQIKTKHHGYTTETQLKLNEYQQQISELTSINDRLTSYIRELEQNNDDLERAQRALAASLEDFEGKLNQEIERNVLLENEISEKKELECVVQRLKEEARDLRHELIAKKNSTDLNKKRQSISLDATATTTSATTLSQTTQTTTISNGDSCSSGSTLTAVSSSNQSSTDSKSPSQTQPTSPRPAMVMPTSSRISALNIVSDLLRKVSALESKLVINKQVG